MHTCTIISITVAVVTGVYVINMISIVVTIVISALLITYYCQAAPLTDCTYLVLWMECQSVQ